MVPPEAPTLMPRLLLRSKLAPNWSVPPLSEMSPTVNAAGAAPSPASELTRNVPPTTAVPPAYVLLPPSTSVPAPLLVIPPAPAITELIVAVTPLLVVTHDPLLVSVEPLITNPLVLNVTFPIDCGDET